MRAGHDILCSLIIAPDGITYQELAEESYEGRDQRIVLTVTRENFELPVGSMMVFHPDYDGLSVHDMAELSEDRPNSGYNH